MKMRSNSLTVCAYNQIRNMIIRNELQPGSFFNESTLQEQLQMGRTPIHEALLLLNADGLVTIIPRKGLMVTPVTVKAINDVFYIRKILEPEAIRQGWQKLDRQWLEESKVSFLKVFDEKLNNIDSVLKYEHQDVDFHNTIVRTMNNSYVDAIVDNYTSQYMLISVFTSSRCERSITVNMDHVHIIDALLAGDAEGAANFLYGHLCSAHRDVLEHYGFSSESLDSMDGLNVSPLIKIG